MLWVRLTGRAFRNMLRYVASDPFSPLRLLTHLAGVVILFLIATLILTSGSACIMLALKIHDGLLASTITLVSTLLVLALTFRALVHPMVMRFGYDETSGDTHGSARFARPARPRPRRRLHDARRRTGPRCP